MLEVIGWAETKFEDAKDEAENRMLEMEVEQRKVCNDDQKRIENL